MLNLFIEDFHRHPVVWSIILVISVALAAFYWHLFQLEMAYDINACEGPLTESRKIDRSRRRSARYGRASRRPALRSGTRAQLRQAAAR